MKMPQSKLLFAGLLGAAAAVSLSPAPAMAAWTFVGSWQVGQPGAPVWSAPAFSPNGPLAYTGQEAAALLFGGSPFDYAISTVDSNPSNINNKAWYSVWAGGGGIIAAENYVSKYLGLYYGPQSGGSGTASAYVIDWCGPRFIPGNCGPNFAFRQTKSVPAPLPLLGAGIAFGYSRRLRKRISLVSKSLA